MAVSPLFTVLGSLVSYGSLGSEHHGVDAYEQIGDHVCWMLRIKYEVAFLWFDRVRAAKSHEPLPFGGKGCVLRLISSDSYLIL